MEIVDPAEVEASGDGLETAEINRRATFNVAIGRNGSSRDLKVQIRCIYDLLFSITAQRNDRRLFLLSCPVFCEVLFVQ